MKNAKTKTYLKPVISALAFMSSVMFAAQPVALAFDKLDSPTPGLDSKSQLHATSEGKWHVDELEATQKVNINLASYEQLVALPGIGKVKATAIMDYRKEVGMFKVLEDLQNIKGIGEKLFSKLSDKISI